MKVVNHNDNQEPLGTLKPGDVLTTDHLNYWMVTEISNTNMVQVVNLLTGSFTHRPKSEIVFALPDAYLCVK